MKCEMPEYERVLTKTMISDSDESHGVCCRSSEEQRGLADIYA
jgi:hypothetical protein